MRHTEGRSASVSALITNTGAYRASEHGTYRDLECFQLKAGDSWLTPESTEDSAQDRYVEYGIEPER